MAIKTVKGLIRRARSVQPWIVPYLENLEKDINLINEFCVYPGEGGRTLLSVVSDLELVKGLIRLGADINKPAFNSYEDYWERYVNPRLSNVSYYCLTNNFKIVKYLLEEGCIEVNKKDCYGNSLLHYAIIDRFSLLESSRDLKLCKLLIQYGADILSLNKLFLTPLSDIRKELQRLAYEELIESKTNSIK